MTSAVRAGLVGGPPGASAIPDEIISSKKPSPLFHGTDLKSAEALLKNPKLDADVAAAKKIDGPEGFYLADDVGDAEFFAARREPGAILQYDIDEGASAALAEAGAVTRPIPRGARSPYFQGNEFVVPPEAFNLFNALLDAGKILVRPFQGQQ